MEGRWGEHVERNVWLTRVLGIISVGEILAGLLLGEPIGSLIGVASLIVTSWLGPHAERTVVKESP